ncbi:OmpH family outer membrane protein [Massilia sp. H-1]|nr:OmpH family outer membrane protein [Massilia sp. H-1]
MPKRLLLVAALCVCSLAQAQRAPSRIGIVYIERLMIESKMAKAADAKIEAEFSKRAKAVQDQISHFKAMSDKFDGEAPTLAESDRIRRARAARPRKDVQRAQREFHEDLIQRKSEERDNIGVKAKKIIEQIAEQEQLDVVLQDPVWFSARIDLTDKVLKALDK